MARDIYLRIEGVEDYSPVEPQTKTTPPIEYKRDGMRNPGHGSGTISDLERDQRAMRAVVYRQYRDAEHMVPVTSKIVAADVNEPVWSRRVPGCVLWAYVGETLKIHVYNADFRPHSFHVHGLRYGIDSDGAWPMGTVASDGRRSDEICPGQQWTYTFEIDKEMVGAWPFHDHSSNLAGNSIALGLFGGLIVRERRFKKPIPVPIPEWFEKDLKRIVGPMVGDRPVVRDALPKRARQILDDQLEQLHEWAIREQRFFKKPKPDRRLHVPVFFHEMSSDVNRPLFDSGDLDHPEPDPANPAVTLPGDSWSHTFDTPGTYPYHCAVHPQMTGTVVVTAGGTPASVPVSIINVAADNDAFSPAEITVAQGSVVTWTNNGAGHHTVTADQGSSLPTHCINGRGFVGNSPTVVARAGQKIRWYVFNLDLSHNWHNFHPHNQRWRIGHESFDVRSMGPAESFVLDTEAPPVLLLPEDIAEIQDGKRPKDAAQYTLRGDFLFHCHVHHHMRNGMIGVVRSVQEVWLTPEMKQRLEDTVGLPVWDEDADPNPIPDVDPQRCRKLGGGSVIELAVDPEVVFMHACLLPERDEVLYWGETRADQSRLFDPAGPSVATPANQPVDTDAALDANSSDVWSAAHSFLDDASGTIVVHGGFTGNGRRLTFEFDPSSLAWSKVADSTDPRYYATTMPVADGSAITLFGSASKSIEHYDRAAKAWTNRKGAPAAMGHHVFYPWTYLLPDGKLFIAGPHHPTQRFDWEPAITNVESFNTVLAGSRSFGSEKGTSVLLPLEPPDYRPRVVIAGGDGGGQWTAEIIDLAAASPAWSSLPDLNERRGVQVNSVIMPDGRVAIIGGADGVPGGGPVEILDGDDPGVGFERGPEMTYHRVYHSAAIVLRDGRILVGGYQRTDKFEIVSPGYVDKPRPTIAAVPSAAIHFGEPFEVETPDAASIQRVMLMRPGAVTHGWNMTQRAVYCEITGGTQTKLVVEAPPDGNVAPPGWYLLFIVTGLRVPSIGEWVRLTP